MWPRVPLRRVATFRLSRGQVSPPRTSRPTPLKRPHPPKGEIPTREKEGGRRRRVGAPSSSSLFCGEARARRGLKGECDPPYHWLSDIRTVSSIIERSGGRRHNEVRKARAVPPPRIRFR